MLLSTQQNNRPKLMLACVVLHRYGGKWSRFVTIKPPVQFSYL